MSVRTRRPRSLSRRAPLVVPLATHGAHADGDSDIMVDKD
jgi:hypothetical protein